ncbi:Eukaryotic translation initiation factor 3 subunit C [Cichlidogyrus casuarinus]|uniref:Eukaryotic translation initiation factor 3 subunit C n=1 Tax=Cichlidogyrus casuarinus TaxID=1844966 RepID=A0ABD2Q2C7_9PLAT
MQTRFHPVSSESEDERRVVKSATDKRNAEILAIRRNFANHKKIKDNLMLTKDFDELIKATEKYQKFSATNEIPGFFIVSLAELDDYIKDAWDNKKNISKAAAKALTSLRQKVKKTMKDHETQLEIYKEDPDKFKDIEEEKAVDEVVEQPVVDFHPSQELEGKKLTKKKPKKSVSESMSSSDEEEKSEGEASSFGSYSNSYSESTDSNEDPLDHNKDDPAAYFLKVNVEARAKEKAIKKALRDKKPRKTKEPRVKKQVINDDEDREDDDWPVPAHETIVDSLYGEVDPSLQAFEKGMEISPSLVVKRLEEINADRGKNGISTNDQIFLLLQVEKKIEELRFGIGIHAKLLISLITALFDHSAKHAFMPNQHFQKCLELFTLLFDLIENNANQISFVQAVSEEPEQLEHEPYVIKGSVTLLVFQLEQDYMKILRNINSYEVEYVERLRDERKLCVFFDRLIAHLESMKASEEALCSSYMRKIEHLYYKFDFEWAKQQPEWVDDEVGCDDQLHRSKAPEHESVGEMRRLCEYIYSNDVTDRLRTRAILCHIYHLALYGYWFRARDLMLMSNLQASIDHADQATMVLYNRAMVQLGLCAFRQGHISDAHNSLADIIGSNRVRELLAQQMSQNRYNDKSPQDEALERSLQVPYHMHINTDLLECVYLVSTMLLEIPLLAAHETDMRWRHISKAFHQALRTHDRAVLSAPPESSRDHVIMAAKCMRVGNWSACVDYLFNAKMDSKIWNLFFHADRIKKMLTHRIKEESLRSYMFMYSAVHDSMSLHRLADQFSLPKTLIYSIISKMIINQELTASLEVPSDFLIIHKTERSRLQTLALQLADKVNGIVEMNEKITDNRSGMGLLGGKGYQSYQSNRRNMGSRYNQARY